MARTLEILIERNVRGERASIVTPEPIPDESYAAQEFVADLYPHHAVMYLPRERIFGTRDTPSPYLGGGVGTYSVFFQTLQQCFNRHLPIAFRPEVLWYLILHEVAQTVRMQPDRYRNFFTNDRGRKAITIDIDPRTWNLCVEHPISGDWESFLEQLSGTLRREMPSALDELLLPTFTTETPVSRAATAVAFMEAVSQYYDYRWRLLCGLPLIRLDGEPSDYATLVKGAEGLRIAFGKDLGRYFDHLLPVLKTIADQAAGAPIDHRFWGSIYNLDSGSGGSDGTDSLGGWITAFVNYVRMLDDGGPPTVRLASKPAKIYDWTQGERWMSVAMVPNHVSAVDCLVTHSMAADVSLTFIGGMLGAEVDEGFVQPQLSFGVLRRNG